MTREIADAVLIRKQRDLNINNAKIMQFKTPILP